MIECDFFAAPFEFKTVQSAPEGTFEGYGSVFGNMDSHGDVILPGAFSASLAQRKAQGRSIPMHVMHGVFGGDGVPVGVWHDAAEDSHGLHVKGKVSGMNTDAGRLLYERVKDGALGGLSIGYTVPKDGAIKGTQPGEARRQLKTIDLREISLVDDPSNAMARVAEIKSRAGFKGISAPGTAADAIAAAIALYQSVLKGSDSPTAQERADLLEHLQAAHEALTGQRIAVEAKGLLDDDLTLLPDILSSLGLGAPPVGGLIDFDLAGLKAMSMGSPGGTSFGEAMQAAMKRMNAGMAAADMAGGPDRCFVSMMIPHHQGAIDMAHLEIEHGKDPALLDLARSIVSAQTSEVAKMRSWLSDHPAA